MTGIRVQPIQRSGGIACRGGIHASAPFGHIWFDEASVVIWGTGLAKQVPEVRVTRAEVAHVRLSTGLFGTRVTVIDAAGVAKPTYFVALGRRSIRSALADRGWLIDDRYVLRKATPPHS